MVKSLRSWARAKARNAARKGTLEDKTYGRDEADRKDDDDDDTPEDVITSSIV
uniref:Uncharacterized protein MANES_15G067800 n=1 Tax=Rhizophora mucronata TaxID=61149 RepID=A0A2P2N1F6_RHIMU